MADIDRFDVLVNEYRQLFYRKETDRSGSFIDRFAQVKDGFLVIKTQTEQIARIEAPEFNIFDLLGVSRDEVRTHSAMLAELLNPNGSHGQGTLFLNSFYELCMRKDPDGRSFPRLPESLDQGKWIILQEHGTSFGRMDVVVLNPTIGFLCVIENKIDAFEQDRQLERYFAWIDTVPKEFRLRGLVYLTVRGFEAATSANRPYIPLSYRVDIVNWLESVLYKIEAPAIRVIVQQYRDLVRRL